MVSQASRVIGGFLCAAAVFSVALSQVAIKETSEFRFLRIGYITFIVLDMPMAFIHWLAADCGTLSIGGLDLGPPSEAKHCAYFFARMEGHERVVGDLLALFLTYKFPHVTIYLMVFKIIETILCFVTLVLFQAPALKDNHAAMNKAPTRFKVLVRLILLIVPISLQYICDGKLPVF
jgi:hypothetical protein